MITLFFQKFGSSTYIDNAFTLSERETLLNAMRRCLEMSSSVTQASKSNFKDHLTTLKRWFGNDNNHTIGRVKAGVHLLHAVLSDSSRFITLVDTRNTLTNPSYWTNDEQTEYLKKRAAQHPQDLPWAPPLPTITQSTTTASIFAQDVTEAPIQTCDHSTAWETFKYLKWFRTMNTAPYIGIRIYIKDAWWFKEHDDQFRGQIFYHELSHRILGTADSVVVDNSLRSASIKIYGEEECQYLAHAYPATTFYVADTWALFARSIHKIITGTT